MAADRERGAWNSEFLKGRDSSVAGKNPKAASLILGLTAWRYRVSLPGDTVRALFHGAEFTPERIGVSTLVKSGDRIQITVEPGRAGFLYIASREVYEHSMGEAALIFPSRRIRGGRAYVVPGDVIAVPEASNPVPYLTLEARDGQRAEQLILVLTDKEIPRLLVDDHPIPVGAALISEWIKRWGSEPRMLETGSRAGVAVTPAEYAAAIKGLRLGPSDPIPQTLFRPVSEGRDGLLALYSLRIKH